MEKRQHHCVSGKLAEIFLGQEIKSEAVASPLLCVLLGKMNSGEWFHWAALARIGILGRQSIPIQKPLPLNCCLPDFFCQNEHIMDC